MDSETRLLALAVLISAISLASAVSVGIAVKAGVFDGHSDSHNGQSDSHGGQLVSVDIEYEWGYIAGYRGTGHYVIMFTAPCDGWMIVRYGSAQQYSDERAFHEGYNSIIVPCGNYVTPTVMFYVMEGGASGKHMVQDRHIVPDPPLCR